jgi:Ca-activated chloride channel family protein
VGLGRNFDEALLEGMARAAEGRFYFAERPADLPPIFASEVGDALQIVAPAARLEIDGGRDGIELLSVSAFQHSRHGERLQVALGDVCADQLLSVVVEVRLPPAPAGATHPLHIRLYCQDSAAALVEQTVVLQRLAESQARAARRDGRAWQVIASQRLHHVRLRALACNQRGDVKEAAQLLLDEAEVLRWLSGPLADSVAAIHAQLLQDAQRLQRRLDDLAYKLAHSESSYAVKSRGARGTSLKTLDFDRFKDS